MSSLFPGEVPDGKTPTDQQTGQLPLGHFIPAEWEAKEEDDRQWDTSEKGRGEGLTRRETTRGYWGEGWVRGKPYDERGEKQTM